MAGQIFPSDERLRAALAEQGVPSRDTDLVIQARRRIQAQNSKGDRTMSTEVVEHINRVGADLKKFSEERRQEIVEMQARVQTVEQILAKRQQEGTMDNVTAADLTADCTLRDQEGQRIGTMISNADLRDRSRIAARIGAHAGAASDGEEPISLKEFFRGVAGMRTSDTVRAALSEGTGSAGGYAVPTVLLPGILGALVPASSLLTAGANIGLLETQAKSFNIAAVNAIPTAAWRLESGNVAESDPTFRSITITPQSLAFRFKVSRELLMDAPGMEDALGTAIAQAFAKELDRAGLRGSGTAPEIRGLINMAGVQTIDSGEDGQVLANYAKLINAARAIKEANAPAPTAAIMSPREDETIALFTDTTGQPLRRPDALTGWQFPVTSQIPTNLTVGESDDCSEIYVGDFSQFTFFLREGVSVQKLTELYAETGEIGFVCHTRVDVAAAYAAAFAVIKGVRPPASA